MRGVKSVLWLLLIVVLAIYGAGRGWFGRRLHSGAVTAKARPAGLVAAGVVSQASARSAIKASSAKQILFGDFHVHTTFSPDAFILSLPMSNGEGAHPPSDACDFARYCSQLDFWSINDHVEGETPAQWQETKDAIRQCNAAAGDPANPDMVSFLGWEWTQIGSNPHNHYGHKNVVLRDIEEDKVPSRPIGARGIPGTLGGGGEAATLPVRARIMLELFAPGGNRGAYLDMARYFEDRGNLTPCPDDVDVHQLPLTCSETAATPADLFKKLNQWGFPALVIPHGTTWGFYTPPGSSLDKQLVGDQFDPSKQRLFEIYSGHGNSEEYRDWRPVLLDAQGNASCPQPGKDYLPSCWRAGEIIRKRCQDAGLAAEVCEQRASEARQNYVEAGVSGFLTVPGATIQDWEDAGQCRDCFLPAFNFRPANSAQYALAIRNFDDPQNPRRFEFGFIGSSDNHRGRAGTGYKEMMRRYMTEAAGGNPQAGARRRKPVEPIPQSVPLEQASQGLSAFQMLETERQSSFFLTGGLVAVHAAGRDRGSIWDALQRREVYATSGDRILLWFDLTGPNGTYIPMGAETRSQTPPHFVAHAVGAFKQKPGCPDYSVNALSPERLQSLCRNECYNPSDERKLITRIDVIRVLPQKARGEAVTPLIKDPWKSFTCAPNQDGCTVEFDDPEFAQLGRDATYYVRALEEPSAAIDGGELRCEYNDKGECVKVHPCSGGDDCLADVQERAWSSPIYVNFGG